MADELYSPPWWRDKLYTALVGRLPVITRAEKYYDGDHELRFVSEKYKAAFARMLRDLDDNWIPLVVDAVEERLHIDGFRLEDATKTDADAWGLWQANFLDADSELLHRTSLVTGTAYTMVWFGAGDSAEITVEHPSELIVAYAPGSRRVVAAALKVWRDEWTSTMFANVYLPDGIYKYETPARESIATSTTPPTWSPKRNDELVQNPLGIVPIVEFRNRPMMKSNPKCGVGGRSEFAEVTSTQDQINKLVCDMLVAAEFAAFRQRWATGLETEKDPDSGEDLKPFEAALDRLWTAADEKVTFGEFGAADLGNYVKAIENRVQSMASRTRTPPHYLLGSSGSFPSGESLKATETGLVAKSRSKMRHLGESWEATMRLAGLITKNDVLAKAHGMETVWTDPESRTEAERADALVKRKAIGVPNEQLWEDAGYTPQQRARFKQMLLDEALQQLIAGAPPAPPAPVGAPPA